MAKLMLNIGTKNCPSDFLTALCTKLSLCLLVKLEVTCQQLFFLLYLAH